LRRPTSIDATDSEHCSVSLWTLDPFEVTKVSRHCSPSASKTLLASLLQSSSRTLTDCSATSLDMRAVSGSVSSDMGNSTSALQNAATAPGTSTTLRAVLST